MSLIVLSARSAILGRSRRLERPAPCGLEAERSARFRDPDVARHHPGGGCTRATRYPKRTVDSTARRRPRAENLCSDGATYTTSGTSPLFRPSSGRVKQVTRPDVRRFNVITPVLVLVVVHRRYADRISFAHRFERIPFYSSVIIVRFSHVRRLLVTVESSAVTRISNQQ